MEARNGAHAPQKALESSQSYPEHSLVPCTTLSGLILSIRWPQLDNSRPASKLDRRCAAAGEHVCAMRASMQMFPADCAMLADCGVRDVGAVLWQSHYQLVHTCTCRLSSALHRATCIVYFFTSQYAEWHRGRPRVRARVAIQVRCADAHAATSTSTQPALPNEPN